jgi:RNA polymerase sigma-70 factor (ECF subfamily)
LDGNSDDSVLLARLRARDADALLALYRLYGPRVFSLSYRMLGDRGAAEEVVQDTFWKLWQRPEMFDPQRGVLIAWLYTVSRNLALDRKRKQNRSPLESVVTNMDGRVNGAIVPEMAAMADPAMARVIREAMDALPAEQKKVIELAYFEDLSHTEISRQLDTALGTIKTRLRLGLSKLREAMRDLSKVRR